MALLTAFLPWRSRFNKKIMAPLTTRDTLSVNATASGGNASLLSLDEGDPA